MLILKIIAGFLCLVVCLAWYPLWELGAMLLGGLIFLSWQLESTRRHEELMAHLRAQSPPRPPAATREPPRPRIGYTSYEDYRSYRQAHGLPYTSVESMWSDGS